MAARPRPRKSWLLEAAGESRLPGHIKGANETEDGSGSIAYVPPEAEDDLQLQQALKLLRGEEKNAAFPPSPDQAAVAD